MSNSSLHIVCPHCLGINRVPEEKLGAGGKCGKCSKKLFVQEPVSLDSSNFDHFVMANDTPLLVDFWAPWCGPCKMMAPIFAQAAAQLEPKVRLIKVNTEEEQSLAARYNIRSIPTIAIFKQGRIIERVAGAMELSDLVAWTKQNS